MRRALILALLLAIVPASAAEPDALPPSRETEHVVKPGETLDRKSTRLNSSH